MIGQSTKVPPCRRVMTRVNSSCQNQISTHDIRSDRTQCAKYYKCTEEALYTAARNINHGNCSQRSPKAVPSTCVYTGDSRDLRSCPSWQSEVSARARNWLRTLQPPWMMKHPWMWPAWPSSITEDSRYILMQRKAPHRNYDRKARLILVLLSKWGSSRPKHFYSRVTEASLN